MRRMRFERFVPVNTETTHREPKSSPNPDENREITRNRVVGKELGEIAIRLLPRTSLIKRTVPRKADTLFVSTMYVHLLSATQLTLGITRRELFRDRSIHTCVRIPSSSATVEQIKRRALLLVWTTPFDSPSASEVLL